MPTPPLQTEDARRTQEEVHKALQMGGLPIGRAPKPGRCGAITMAARSMGEKSRTIHSRCQSGGSCERAGFPIDWSLYQRSEEEQKKETARRGGLGYDPVLPGYEIKSVSSQRDSSGNLEKEWIKQDREHGSEFEIPSGHIVKGVSALIDGDGRTIQQWIKTKEDGSGDVIDALKIVFDEYKGRAELIQPPEHTNSDLMTIYPIGDMHLGLYAWAPESGEDWDLKHGETVLRETMAELVSTAPNSETAVILSLGDFFHTDDSSNRTPHSGNALDVDTRRNKVLQVGVKLLIDCVELALQKHKTVIVRCLAGNHDPATTPALTISLWAFFHANPRVEIDSGPSKFFYKQFGKVMVAATHGDQCKLENMPGVMASTQPEMWGSSRFRVCYSGHVHHRQQICKEVNGVVCESFQVLPPADSWHAGMGYGAGRSMMAITHHKDFGEKLRNVVSICPSF